MIYSSPLFRAVLYLGIFVSSVIVLGLSAYLYENNLTALNFILITERYFVLNFVVGSLGIIYSAVALPLTNRSGMRRARSGKRDIEIGLIFVLWVLWLAASAAYTEGSQDAREVCDQGLVSYTSRSGSNTFTFSGATPRKILSSLCPMSMAILAFLWIGWILLSLILLFTGVEWYMSLSRAVVSSDKATERTVV